MEEMQRRLAAAMIHHEIKADEARGKLFLDAGRDLQIIFAKQSRDGPDVDEELRDYMANKIKDNNIGLVIVDPGSAPITSTKMTIWQ